jgi:hypothetical protein
MRERDGVANGSSEMVLVNYNSQDELDVWIRQFRSAIAAGTLRYVHERSDPDFHMSKAKNLAHFAATGEFVVNLDADNLTGNTIATWRRFWQANPDTIIHGLCRHAHDGTHGRIGMARRHFLALGGYDEEMLAGGYEDSDLLRRAKAYGLDFIRLAQKGTAAMRNPIPGERRATARFNYRRMEESGRIGRLVANGERKRRSVLINFSTEVEL